MKFRKFSEVKKSYLFALVEYCCNTYERKYAGGKIFQNQADRGNIF